MDGTSLSEKFNNQLYTISSGNWTEVKSVFSPAIFFTTEVNFAEHLFYSNVVFEFPKISYIFANEETQI